jgi:hypothetical protein
MKCPHFHLLVTLGIVLRTTPLPADDTKAAASTSTNSFAIVVEGTNLVLSAAIPPNLEQVILETHSTLDGSWEEAGLLDLQAGVREVSFRIPKPVTPTAFFRLRAKQSLGRDPLISGELRYVTMLSLGSSLAHNGDAILHFKGPVDGSDKILITREGALWNHVHWDWPRGSVTVNGNRWEPKEKNYLTTPGTAAFLPETFSLESVELEPIQGRDVVALEHANNALIVYLDDTPVGADTYEFKIHFPPISRAPVKGSVSAVAKLKITAQIDGSDRFKFTATEASWDHKAWSYPAHVTLNGVPWDPQSENVRKNEGTNRFLPSGIDFSTARIVGRKGRDLATMWSDSSAMWILFADNPNGGDAYELEISFGR